MFCELWFRFCGEEGLLLLSSPPFLNQCSPLPLLVDDRALTPTLSHRGGLALQGCVCVCTHTLCNKISIQALSEPELMQVLGLWEVEERVM